MTGSIANRLRLNSTTDEDPDPDVALPQGIFAICFGSPPTGWSNLVGSVDSTFPFMPGPQPGMGYTAVIRQGSLSLNCTLGEGGAHDLTEPGTTTFLTKNNMNDTFYARPSINPVSFEHTGHSHGTSSFNNTNIATISNISRYRTVRFVSVDAANVKLIPTNIKPLSYRNINYSLLTRVTSDTNCLISQTTPYNGELISNNSSLRFTSESFSAGNAAGLHIHHQTQSLGSGLGSGNWNQYGGSGATNHTHNVSISCDYIPPAITCALYEPSAPYKVRKGMIFFWNNNGTGTLPPGWQMCDGTNGTPDFRGRTIYLTDSNTVGESVGSFTLSGPYETTVSSVGHNHIGNAETSNSSNLVGAFHADTKNHNDHPVTITDATFSPRMTKRFQFITYTG